MEISSIEELQDITHEQIDRFLTENGGYSPCEVCGRDQWTLARISDGHIIYVYQDVVFAENRSLVYLPLTCQACMNTRYFNALGMAYRILKGDGV